MYKTLLAVCLVAAFAVPLGAQGVTQVEVDGTSVTATIELAGGVAADLEIEFENVVGLNTGDSLGLAADLVDPTDALLLARLPDANLISIPATFPVLVTIEPPAAGGLAFSGIVTVELHTHNLIYTAASPLRLFSAPLDGAFKDITSYAGSGSYRVQGSQGGFSEFLIVADVRPSSAVIAGKFARIESILTDNTDAIDGDVGAELWGHLNAASAAWSAGDTLAAVESMKEFGKTVENRSGCGIPNVWRSSRDLVNVAGELRAAALTQLFSLRQESSQGS